MRRQTSELPSSVYMILIGLVAFPLIMYWIMKPEPIEPITIPVVQPVEVKIEQVAEVQKPPKTAPVYMPKREPRKNIFDGK